MSQSLKQNFREVMTAVAPIATFVFILQFTLVYTPWNVILRFAAGTLFILVGLTLFLHGVRIGLLPIGEAIGSELPKRGSAFFLLVFALLLGFIVTVAEPSVHVLAEHVESASSGNISKFPLIVTVSAGTGVCTMLAILRILLNFRIAYILAGGYLMISLLSFFTPPEFAAISFDAGGVTTGSLSVPFILSLGLGAVSVMGGKTAFGDGFGIIGIASIGPVIGTMILGILLL